VVRTLLSITRPRFWFYTAGPFLLGYMAGQTPPRNLLVSAFWLPFLYFLVPANLYLYGINDLFDRDTDALNTKKGEQEHRLATVETARLRWLLYVVLALDVLILALLPDWSARALFALFVLLCTAYSAPPIRFKARPFLDSYSNVLYVIPGFLGYYLTAGTWPPLLVMLGAALWAAGMHAFSALPDIAPDAEAGVHTVATALGERNGLLFVAANWLGFALLIGTGVAPQVGLLLLVYPVLALALYFNPRWSVTRAYWGFPFLNGAFGFLAFLVFTVNS